MDYSLLFAVRKLKRNETETKLDEIMDLDGPGLDEENHESHNI